MARIDYKQEARFAQKEIYGAGKLLSSAKMRLAGTKYASDMNKVWDALSALNTRIVKDLNAK